LLGILSFFVTHVWIGLLAVASFLLLQSLLLSAEEAAFEVRAEPRG